MPTEKDFEALLAKYPELIEDGLRLLGCQVTVQGRRMDMLFQDRLGRKLIVELKWGPIKDEHIGQLMSYEGLLLSADDPTLRVMLIGTRVPPNIRRSLDHHGIAWKEISPGQISSFMTAANDPELARLFIEEDRLELKPARVRIKPDPRPTSALARFGSAAALLVPTQAKWLEAAFNHFRSGEPELYFVTNASIGQAANLPLRQVYFKVRGENFVSAQAAFIDISTDNPASKRLRGIENATGRYYYGFRDLRRMTVAVNLTDLRYFSTGKALRNDVPGACLIQEPDESTA